MKKIGVVILTLTFMLFAVQNFAQALYNNPGTPYGDTKQITYRLPATGCVNTVSFKVVDILKEERKKPKRRGFSGYILPGWWQHEWGYSEDKHAIHWNASCIYTDEQINHFRFQREGEEDGKVYIFLQKKSGNKWITVAHSSHDYGINATEKTFLSEYDNKELDPSSVYRFVLENKLPFSYVLMFSCTGIEKVRN